MPLKTRAIVFGLLKIPLNLKFQAAPQRHFKILDCKNSVGKLGKIIDFKSNNWASPIVSENSANGAYEFNRWDEFLRNVAKTKMRLRHRALVVNVVL